MSSTIDRDPLHLHPVMREAVRLVLADCAARGLPFALFEGFRSRARQAELYAQGRTAQGPIVTYAGPGQSYHQYGLAVDIVGFVVPTGSNRAQWTWDRPQSEWNALHAIAWAHGLEPLNFETPHLQLAGLRIEDLMRGTLPPGGDASWRAVVYGTPEPAPIVPPIIPTRPAQLEPKVLSADDLNDLELRRVQGG